MLMSFKRNRSIMVHRITIALPQYIGRYFGVTFCVAGFTSAGIDSTAPMIPPTPYVADTRKQAPSAEDLLTQSSVSGPAAPQFWCPPEIEFLGTSPHLSTRFDPVRKLTEVYIGDYDNDQILRHEFDSSFNQSVVTLPLAYGLPWLAEDLDRDGQFELVIQRGDPGFGGNGYLDVVSSLDWTLRKRFTFANKKGWMHPRAVNLDADPYSELFFMLNDGFGGPCQAAIVDYSPDGGFYLRSLVSVPWAMGGPAAIGDADGDGLMEIVTGGPDGYGLFEWRNDSLYYIGLIDSTFGNNNAASLFVPKPDGIPRLLIGHSTTPEFVSMYEVLIATGDNTFARESEFSYPIFGGLSTSITGDSDCDGLDELVVVRWPWYVEYGWDEPSQDYVERCSWNASDSMAASLHYWHAVDFDRNNSPEWLTVAGDDSVYAFTNPDCIQCDGLGRCTIPPP